MTAEVMAAVTIYCATCDWECNEHEAPADELADTCARLHNIACRDTRIGTVGHLLQLAILAHGSRPVTSTTSPDTGTEESTTEPRSET